MIYLNDKQIDIQHYPVGEVRFEVDKTEEAKVTWFYKDSELSAFIFLLEKLREWKADIEVTLPYFPYARMDRIKEENQLFSLKYFIKQLVGTKVKTYDVHSFVVADLMKEFNIPFENIERSEVLIKKLIAEKGLNKKDLVVLFPDETAYKRFGYVEKLFSDSLIAYKKRDFNTGKILSIEIESKDLTGKAVIMVDDICSYGGTFIGNIEEIKKTSNPDFYLVVTHLEQTQNPKLRELVKDIYYEKTLDWNQ